MSQSLDFARVKTAHRSWRVRLRRFLDGSAEIDPAKLGSYQDCELGKWIYADALLNYGHLPEIARLEKEHKDMHGLVAEVVHLKHAGNSEEAERRFTEVAAAADKVVSLLNGVERQLTGSGQPARSASA